MAKRIIWTDSAKSDVRAIDQRTALYILHGLARFVLSNDGDVKQLHGIDPPEFRLRVGNYRIRFHDHRGAIEILTVKHRREAYR